MTSAQSYEELNDLRVMRDLIRESLSLPPSASTREVTVAARVALIKLAVEEALAEARLGRAFTISQEGG